MHVRVSEKILQLQEKSGESVTGGPTGAYRVGVHPGVGENVDAKLSAKDVVVEMSICPHLTRKISHFGSLNGVFSW